MNPHVRPILPHMIDASLEVPEPHPVVHGEGAQALAPLLEHVRDGCIFVDYEMRVGFLNAVARKDLRARGADPEQFPGNSLWDLLHYPSDTPSRRAVEQAAAERVPTYFTTKGTYGPYWVDVDVVPLESGCLLYYRDATPQSSAEKARMESESELRMTSERLRVLVDEAPLAVIVIDNDARVLHWNPAAEAMFQWTEGEVIGRALPTVPDEDRESFEVSSSQARQGGSLRAMPARRQRKDGVVLDVQIWSSPMRDSAGAVVGAIAMITDITANRKLEAQREPMQRAGKPELGKLERAQSVVNR